MNKNKGFQIPMDVIEECLKECLDNTGNENGKEKTSSVSSR
ncbi:hypothetical protein N4T77_08800 [Clostridium sp. CX1]|uniref:Uncharacterized protein n=1 Tax=Clostridium tanneri TaxID=3037988 RepID=A0ABU4JUT0_9CLOT|nr:MULTISPECIES: hypothetical protein [unclassified Clostridium]MCT8976695.1 hypothetical protein [Clostridium sp. CX1]MDW8801895.1 hypothetical protein [Clostridium sp. A1-XYC3]